MGMECSLCIHLFSSSSQSSFASLVSGGDGIKVATFMIIALASEGDSVVLVCLYSCWTTLTNYQLVVILFIKGNFYLCIFYVMSHISIAH